MIFKEEVVHSEVLYEGRILNFRKDEVTVAGGGTASREIVEHNGAVAMVAITKENKIVMVKQYRHAMRDVVLEIPAGKIDKQEDPEKAAARELKEETGYTAAKVTFLGKMYPSVAYSEEGVFLYFCTDLTPGETNFDDDEAIDLVAYDFEEVCKMAESGQLIDSKTICGVLMVKGQLDRGLLPEHIQAE